MREEMNSLPKTIVRDGITYLLDESTMTYDPQIDFGQDETTEEIPLGKYAQRAQRYLKEHRPMHYSKMQVEMTLQPFLRALDEEMEQKEHLIVAKLQEVYPKPNGENFIQMAQWRNTVYPKAEEQLMEEFYQQYPPENRAELFRQALVQK